MAKPPPAAEPEDLSMVTMIGGGIGAVVLLSGVGAFLYVRKKKKAGGGSRRQQIGSSHIAAPPPGMVSYKNLQMAAPVQNASSFNY